MEAPRGLYWPPLNKADTCESLCAPRYAWVPAGWHALLARRANADRIWRRMRLAPGGSERRL